MEISPGIEMVETSLWLKKEKVLIINDLHLGYEEALHRKGILVPRFQLQEILDSLERIMGKILGKSQPESIKTLVTNTSPKTPPIKTLVINGDLKHEFGTILQAEWREVLQFLDFCLNKCGEVIIIRGNHDPSLKFIAEKMNVQVRAEFQTGDTLIVHGDELVNIRRKGIMRVIIGHEHPAITLRRGSKREKYKCFLKGKWRQDGRTLNRRKLQQLQRGGKGGRGQPKELIAVPSFNPLLEGSDVLKEQLLSPFLSDLTNFEVFIVSKGEAFAFGSVGKVARMNL